METLLALANLGQRTYGRWLFHRLISGIFVVVGLTIIISIMISAVLVGSLMAAYFTFIHYGVYPQIAMVITGVLAILIITLLILLTLLRLRHLRKMPQTLLKQSPVTSCAAGVLQAFLDGFMGPIR